MQAIRISKTRLNEMKEAIKLSDLIRYYCPDLDSFGRNKFCICPFHGEKTGSLCVNDTKAHFHCFGCGESGDHLSFIYAKHLSPSSRWARDTLDDMSILNTPSPGKVKSFMKCVRILSQVTGIPIKRSRSSTG